MHKHRIRALRLGISRDRLTLVGTGGWLRRHTEILRDVGFGHDGSPGLSEIGARLEGALPKARRRRLPIAVVVADDLARFFMATPPHNTRRLQDCRAAAEMRFQALYGESAAEWQLAGEWNFSAPFLVCALPRALLQAIRSAADVHRLTPVEIVPQFVAAWNASSSSLKPDAWFGVKNGPVLTLAAIKDKQLLSVRTTSVSEGDARDKHWLMQHAAREALRINTDVPACVQLYGAIPSAWLSPPDGGMRCERLPAQQDGAFERRPAGVALAETGGSR